MKNKLFFLIVVLNFTIINSQNQGNLFIIGGGTIPDYLISKFIEIGGGANEKFVIIPMASAEPNLSATNFKNKLLKFNCTNIEVIIGDKNNIDCDSNLFKLNNAKGIFFTGGDQNKLTSLLLNTKFIDKVKKIYFDGGVIGGTSAGAAVMSKAMITGNEIINKDSTNSFNLIKKGNVEISEGFGFISECIIDQHFILRKRLQRLISSVLDYPKLIGIGIDESTAIIVNSKKEIEVIGESLVIIIDVRESTNYSIDFNNNQSIKDIKMHLLKNGDKIKIEN